MATNPSVTLNGIKSEITEIKADADSVTFKAGGYSAKVTKATLKKLADLPVTEAPVKFVPFWVWKYDGTIRTSCHGSCKGRVAVKMTFEDFPGYAGRYVLYSAAGGEEDYAVQDNHWLPYLVSTEADADALGL